MLKFTKETKTTAKMENYAQESENIVWKLKSKKFFC